MEVKAEALFLRAWYHFEAKKCGIIFPMSMKRSAMEPIIIIFQMTRPGYPLKMIFSMLSIIFRRNNLKLVEPIFTRQKRCLQKSICLSISMHKRDPVTGYYY